MADRTTKMLLIAIAAGLWLNLADAWFTTPVQAQSDLVTLYLSHIDANIRKLANGTCTNAVLCR